MYVNLEDYDWIVVNSSGGKDSQTALTEIVRMADEQEVSRDKIVVVHCDLGEAEWSGTKQLAQLQAELYGLRFEVTKRRNREGDEETLLAYVERRGKWPSSTQRYCTSDFKRGPAGRVITMLHREICPKGGVRKNSRILNVMGFRAEESPARAKRQQFTKNDRMSTKTRDVFDYLPIHEWSEDEVWQSIKDNDVPYHRAYDLGMPRLSCCFCIFAPRAALIIAGKHNPQLLEKYCDVEERIGHTFRKDLPIVNIREAIARGETVDEDSKELNGCWNM